jgi:hypothetical protein
MEDHRTSLRLVEPTTESTEETAEQPASDEPMTIRKRPIRPRHAAHRLLDALRRVHDRAEREHGGGNAMGASGHARTSSLIGEAERGWKRAEEAQPYELLARLAFLS